jgi:CHASE2 domain-containing sensor protein
MAGSRPNDRAPSRATIEWWLLAAVLLALVLGLAHAGRAPSDHALARVDAALYDLAIAAWARAPNDAVLVVAIDDDSLAQVGRWPWRRAVAALLIERLQAAGPRAIGLDVLFAEPAEGDDRLAEAIALGPAPVVLPVARQRELPVLPVPELGAGRVLAHVEFPVDGDGRVRGLWLREGGFPALAHRLAFPAAPAPTPAEALAAMAAAGGWTREGHVRPGATRGAPHQVSAAAVMRGDVPPQAIRDRLVLVGATARGLGDTHATTLYAGETPVPGVALHAAAAAALLEGRLLRAPPPGLRLGGFAAVLLAVLAVLYATEPRTGLACVAGALAAVAAGAVALAGAGWWIAPGALLVGLALAFPLWSWRRLHAASVGLIAQAARLEADAEHGAVADGAAPLEPIARRLRRLERAAERIRELNRSLARALESLRAASEERERTLRFLSHDLRAPHLSILSLLQRRADGGLDPADTRAIERQSRHALELTDGFMHLARAESQPLRAEPHDLADLAIEAADGCWQRAAERGLRIVTPPAPVDGEPGAVATCDAQLVRRALVNLLDNAMRAAPRGSAIEVAVEREGPGWRLSVSDHGPGIPEADRERVFRPWWRGAEADPSSGAGLGLAFVALVAQRHGGRVRALEVPGGGARLELWLSDAAGSPPAR